MCLRFWISWHQRLIARGWSLLGFGVLIGFLGFTLFLLGLSLALFQGMHPENLGNALTYSWGALLFVFLLLYYMAYRLSRKTDWHRAVLWRYANLQGYAFAFFLFEPGILGSIGLYAIGLGIGLLMVFPLSKGLAALGLTLLFLIGVVALLSSGWFRWGLKAHGRRDLPVAFIPVFWILGLVVVASNASSAMQAWMGHMLAYLQYVPLLGPYGEAMAAALSGASVCKAVAGLATHVTAAVLIAWALTRG